MEWVWDHIGMEVSSLVTGPTVTSDDPDPERSTINYPANGLNRARVLAEF